MKKTVNPYLIAIVVLALALAGSLLYIFLHEAEVIEVEHQEIERKWLIDPNNIPYDLTKADKYTFKQTYINFNPEIRVREIDNGKYYTFAVKMNTSEDGLVRNEFEYYIPRDQYLSLVKKQEGNTIHKTRYMLKENGVEMSIDIFLGALTGLGYLEIEFKDADQARAFGTPDWVIRDVTSDERYKNGSLAQHGIPAD